MHELKIFESPEFGTVRTVTINGEPWLVGKDVAEALGYSNTRDALDRHVDTEDKNTVANPDGKRGNPNMTIINESGLYALVLSSKLPTARRYRHWVTSEVLPSIRKHGLYATAETAERLLSDPDFVIRLFTEIKAEKEMRQQLEAEAAANAPKVLFADSVEASKTSILVFDLAKLIRQNGVDIGGKRLFAWMRDNGYLVRRKGADYNMPTQKAMEMGLFEVKETAITYADGHISVNRTPKVTGRGQVYFINKFLARA